MNDLSSEKLRQVGKANRLLKTLSNEQRLLILCILGEKEMTVSELTRLTNLPQTTVSQHLSRMRSEELVAFERKGKNVSYKLASPVIFDIIALLQKYYCA